MIGQTIGQYFIQHYVNQGRYGIVYKCRNIINNKIFAIKFNMTNTYEIYEQYNVDHPNLMKIIEIYKFEDKIAIIMPFYRQNLDQVKKDKCQLMFKDIFTQVCKGVKHFHAQGVIHGDIKLNNIMVKYSGKKRIYILTDYSLTQKSQKFEVDIYDLFLAMWDWLFSQDIKNQRGKRAKIHEFYSINRESRLHKLMPDLIDFMRFMMKKQMNELPTIDQILSKLDELPNFDNILKCLKKNKKSSLKHKKISKKQKI